MLNKYFEIKSCYDRENKDTKEIEYVIVCNEIKGKGVVASFTRYFVFNQQDFIKKFGSLVKEDKRNFGLERLPLEVGVEYLFDVHGINKNLPDYLK